MELLRLKVKPPYDHQALQEISQKQVEPHGVPTGYSKQLRHHLQAFPHDYLFQLIPHDGTGFGVIKCLEPGCSSDPIPLRPRTSKSDGGRSVGVGGLAAFQSHIIEHDLHETLRDRRIHRDETQLQPQSIQKSVTPPNLRSSTRLSGSNLDTIADTTNAPAVKSSPHINSARSSTPEEHVNSLSRHPQDRGPLVSSKRNNESFSNNQNGKKIRASPSDSKSLGQTRKSSTFGPVGLKGTRTTISPRTHRKKFCSSDVCAVPDKFDEKKISGPVHPVPIPASSSDNDEIMVWVDGEGLVPLTRFSKPQLGTKPTSANGLIDSIYHLSPFGDQSPPLAQPIINQELHRSPSPRKKNRSAQLLGISGQKPLLRNQSNASGSIFAPDIKPLPAQLLNPQESSAAPSSHLLQTSPSANPNFSFSKTCHIDPSLQPSHSSSALPSTVPKVKPESTPARAAFPGGTPGSSKLPVASNTLGNSKLLDVIHTPGISKLPDSITTFGSHKPLDLKIIPRSSWSHNAQNVPGSSALFDSTPLKRSIQSSLGMGSNSPIDQSFNSLSVSHHLTSLAHSLINTPSMASTSSVPDQKPEMRFDELQEFYKRAVDGMDFCHNATVAEARRTLGICEDQDARMEGLSVILMPHQLIGVSWMLQQESNRNCGGLLADEMGLGKTIQMIATIVKNRSTDPKIKSTLVLAPLALLTQWKEEITDKSTCDLKVLIYHQAFSKPTERKKLASFDVVITTLDTLSGDWNDDSVIGSSSRPRGLYKVKWYRVAIDEAQIIRNPNSKKSRAVCGLTSTYRWCLTGTPIFNGLMDIYPYLRFLRIRPYNDIFEFRQHIARYEKNKPNLATKRAQAVLATCMIRRQKTSRLDGKPLILLPPKTVQDVTLDLSPDERDIYDMLEKQAQRKFNVFLRRGTVLKNFACVLVLLLRLRQACGHPALTIEEGDPDAGVEVNSSFAPGFLDPYSEFKRAFSDLGQAWIDKTKRKFLEEAEELAQIEKENPSQAAAPECPICSDPIDGTSRITTCGHVFCQGCLETLFTQTDPIMDDGPPTQTGSLKKPCPNCRNPFRQCDTYLKQAFIPLEDDEGSDGELPGSVFMHGRKIRNGIIEDSDEDSASASGRSKGKEKAGITPNADFVPSTKLVWMLEEINRVRKEFPSDKIIVISQWTVMLSLCATFLHNRGHRYVQYQGDMNSRERDEAVNKFKRTPTVCIMLMSLKCGGVGLNLTSANRVISLDLAWSPASESQAFDRTHRLGQVKNVFINRVMIRNSVEQRICNLQRKKLDLSDNALGEGTGKKLQRLTVSELANLFNLNTNGDILS